MWDFDAFALGVVMRESWPVDATVDFLRRLDYDVTPNTLAEFERKHYFAPADASEMTAVEIYCLMAALEARRRWKPTPSQHDAKKSGARLAIEQLQAQGIPPVNDLDNHTLEDLLLQLTGCPDRAIRECIYETLVLKLKGLEE